MSIFVCIEGVDAAGKATQSKILAERLGAKLYSFPRYDTEIGKIIKQHLLGKVALREFRSSVDNPSSGTAFPVASEDPLMFQALMLADKCNAAEELQELFLAGTPVVCDRWIPSAICYGAADGVDREWLMRAHLPLLSADLNIFLDITPEEALRRRPEARDRYERDREKQKRVREEYQRLWAGDYVDDETGAHYVTVDGDGGGSGAAAIDVVAERIWVAVETYRKERE